MNVIKDLNGTFDVDTNGQWNIVFAHGAQKRAKVNQPINPMRYHDLLEVLEIQNVRENEWT